LFDRDHLAVQLSCDFRLNLQFRRIGLERADDLAAMGKSEETPGEGLRERERQVAASQSLSSERLYRM
jgi:hypothetical protein